MISFKVRQMKFIQLANLLQVITAAPPIQFYPLQKIFFRTKCTNYQQGIFQYKMNLTVGKDYGLLRRENYTYSLRLTLIQEKKGSARMAIQDFCSDIVNFILYHFRLFIIGLCTLVNKVFAIYIVPRSCSGRIVTWWTAVSLVPNSSEA